MFAGVLEIAPKLEKKDQLIKVAREEILPILKKQPGFLEVVPLMPEIETEHVFTISLWAEKRDAEKLVNEVFPRIEQILKPFVTMPPIGRMYKVETSVCRHFVDALTQVA